MGEIEEKLNDVHPGWVAQLVGVLSRTPKKKKKKCFQVSGSVPSQGVYERQQIDVSLTLMFLPLSLSLPSSVSKINEHILG